MPGVHPSLCRAALYLGLAAIAAATYWQTLSYPLVYDDLAIVERNPIVAEAGGWMRIFTEPYWPRSESLDPLYRPLTTLSFKLNHALFGPDPRSLRAANIALHALVTVLVAALASHLWSSSVPHVDPAPQGFAVTCGVGHPSSLVTHHSALSPAWVAGILFAVHPVHAEALGLAVGRAELLAALFVLWIILRQMSPPTDGIRSPLITSLLFLAGMASKEHAVMAWPTVLLIDYWRGPHGAGRTAWRVYFSSVVRSHHAGMMLALAAFLFARWLIFGGRTTLPSDFVSIYASPLRNASLEEHLYAALSLLWLVLKQWFAAAPLCPIWSIGGFDPPLGFALRPDARYGAIVALIVVALILFGRKRLGRLWPVLGSFALFIMLPCHIVPSANWLYAERWAYLPSVFMALACAGLTTLGRLNPASDISNLKPVSGRGNGRTWSARVSVIGATLVAALLLATTLSYQRCWLNQEALFRSVVNRQPGSYHGNVGLLSVLERSNRMVEGAPYATRLIARFPESERAWYFELLSAAANENWSIAERALRVWSDVRPLMPTPPAVEHIANQLRSRGRGLDIEL